MSSDGMRAPARTRRVRRLGAALAVLAILLTGLPGQAEARTYNAASKFRRGFSNMTMGVLALPGNMAVESKERGYAVGLPLGFATGLGWFVAHELVGVFEFLTCPFEWPPGFRPILQPEYPWQYFEDL